ncbi:hypothetical protein NL676_027419 [Syzygium grande]|nr:hypothetical protein NL676_027419 [Syzygium grande]
MVFNGPFSPARTDSDTESGGGKEIGFRRFLPRMEFAGPSSPDSTRSWPFNTDSDTKSRGKIQVVVFRLALNSDRLGSKALRMLAAYPGVQSIQLDRKSGRCSLVGFGIDPVHVVVRLRKKLCYAEIFTVAMATEPIYTFPTTARITELQSDEDTDLGRKRSLGMLISEDRQEQSEKQQEQPPPAQADCYISQVKASLLSHPLPSMSLPVASKARPSPSSVSPPSRGTSDQMQTTSGHVSELSFPFAPSSSRIFWTESLADIPACSSISGEACLPKDMELMEEEGLGGHNQLSDSAVHRLLSEINGIGERKRHKDLHFGEQASRLKEADDTAIMLRKQVEELEAKLSIANPLERCLRDMLRISEARHAGTERELAFMREEMDKANHRIEYLENEKTEAGASRAGIEGETMSTPGPGPPAPRTTSLSYVPLLLLVLVSQTWKCARKALFFPERELLFGHP